LGLGRAERTERAQQCQGEGQKKSTDGHTDSSLFKCWNGNQWEAVT
jgi:hypothetical protein